MSPELLLTMAAGLLAAAAVIVLILHRILRKQCDEIARRAAQQDLPEVTRRLNDLTERIETQWVSWREQLERAAEGTAEAAGPSGDSGLAARPPIESLSDAILRLDREGLDAIEIARRAGASVGEVELVLNLNRAGIASQE